MRIKNVNWSYLSWAKSWNAEHRDRVVGDIRLNCDENGAFYSPSINEPVSVRLGRRESLAEAKAAVEAELRSRNP